MKQRSFFSVLAAFVLVLLLISAGGFYWLISNSPLALFRGGAATAPAAAMFVPSQAPVMVSLLVNPEQLDAFGQLAAPPAQRRQTRAELAQFKDSLLANTGLTYDQDVQPWLGDEITLAVTTIDIDRNPQNGSVPGYLLALATKDPERSREFLQLFWGSKASAGTDLVFEPYEGTTLIYNNRAKSEQGGIGAVASAVVADQFVLFANHPKVLRDAINNVLAPDLNLSSSSSYQRALERLTQPRIGLTFFNLPQLAALKSPELAVLGSESGSAQVSNETVAIALGLNRQGLLAQTALLLKDPQQAPAAPSLQKPVEALRYIPASVGALVAGSDLRQLWTQISEGLSSDDPLLDLIEQPLSLLGNRWGIDLPQDIFSWVQGEYALALLPRSPDAVNPNAQGDWIFVAEKSADSSPSIEHLDDVAKQQGFSIGSVMLGNQSISAWTKLSTASTDGSNAGPLTLKAQVRGVHASVGQYEIFASNLEAMDEALKAGQGGSLLTSSTFKQGIAPLPQPNYGYVYLDWPASRIIVERQLPLLRLVELAARPVFQHLRSLSASSTGGEAGVRLGDVFIKLGG
ncbi:MAG: DUF3352 domain-containing protein [Microcoleus vaginatus WJT46-NPBG5]|jgi:hypothetical protein|nr:DUF3352 domain-containing protein [Microcoleus vaginatus WJT46-NPBG5]